MVRSRLCHLEGLTPDELVSNHEEAMEMGGYFVVNGNEKLIRMLVANKGNHPVALQRKGWTSRGPGYTKYGITIRSVLPDRTSMTNALHYLADGQVTYRFLYKRHEYFLPVAMLLRILGDTTDKEIYQHVVQGDTENTFLTDRIELMLREQRIDHVNTQAEALDYLGSRFRHKAFLPDNFTNRQIAEYMINNYILVHLPNWRDKFNLICLMVQKLYSSVQGKSDCDNIDATSFHEVLLGGHLFCSMLKERLQEYLETVRFHFLHGVEIEKKNGKNPNHEAILKKSFDRAGAIGPKFESFLATGNLASNSGLDVQQTSGFTIIAEKLNFLRYISHFRSIHRGAFFATMKTSSIRKLMPESFGFLCPVHTPDGAPCGLLNHLSSNCLITKDPLQERKVLESNLTLTKFLLSNGVTSIETTSTFRPGSLPVTFNGRLIGMADEDTCDELVNTLRYLRSVGHENVPSTLEIAYAPKNRPGIVGGQFPGISLFSTGARFMRPVINVKSGKQELIGPQEQLYMNIAIYPEEVKKGITTHVELSPTAMLSVVANLTPFSDYNQSPRNMYQCQMAKQTMGTPMHSYAYRADNKLFKIQNPQKPIVRTINQSKYHVNDYPHGCNAVIAVISNTGYDMEDAMIINKSSYERGFGHGSVYKTVFYDLDEGKLRAQTGRTSVSRPDYQTDGLDQYLDVDGLPHVGRYVTGHEPLYTFVNELDGKQVVEMIKSKEEAWIEEVKIIGNLTSMNAPRTVTKFTVKYRFDRNPVIGDKFASRHGQKGVLSQLWPEINMPFSESGLKPDVIINPNAFPSRMTIGMLIEIMAAKAGAVNGIFQQGTAFSFDEKNTAVKFFGEQLAKAGYNYYGNEPMYSGTTGEEFHADIFFGVCYYQRLRHMVKDKYQVRATGKVNALTRQPVKGRKIGGGIRFGEMERDSMLAHGTSFCLNDRLMKSSDLHIMMVCRHCGSTLTVATKPSGQTDSRNHTTCIDCKVDDAVPVAVPYVFNYLITELAAVNIALKLQIK
ncbi:RNA polymerase I [Cavenderia fasciculata]|uniref:DNA-directed RNA polymerase subunit beta n=1 Tax=Cavenderia fasciculata TaxID=261658 RepID=F4Q7L9_CACFS|nr:RNA polymerase I [Cavenderia fasciculata]EGG16401.1 RNA polymerase I [Cavenderia fasciculata]|eukprot:XP_004354785.1 RNA polymerase I [Cavenderia fasciculata]